VPVLLVVLLGACPDPEGAFNDFGNRIPDAAVIVQPDSPPFENIPDVSGTFLTGLTNDLIIATSSPPVQFLATQTVDKSGGKYMLTLSLQPLSVATREPVGSAIAYAPVEVADNGSFTATVGSLTVPAEADPLPGNLGPIVASNVVIHGQIRSADAHCGTVDGMVSMPVPTDLGTSHTTYAGIRVQPGTTGSDLPPVVKDCAGLSPDAGP
jgi:hypothetical protein